MREKTKVQLWYHNFLDIYKLHLFLNTHTHTQIYIFIIYKGKNNQLLLLCLRTRVIPSLGKVFLLPVTV